MTFLEYSDAPSPLQSARMSVQEAQLRGRGVVRARMGTGRDFDACLPSGSFCRGKIEPSAPPDIESKPAEWTTPPEAPRAELRQSPDRLPSPRAIRRHRSGSPALQSAEGSPPLKKQNSMGLGRSPGRCGPMGWAGSGGEDDDFGGGVHQPKSRRGSYSLPPLILPSCRCRHHSESRARKACHLVGAGGRLGRV